MSDNRHRIRFVAEMLNILSKYNLSDFLTNYTKHADFPEKPHFSHDCLVLCDTDEISLAIDLAVRCSEQLVRNFHTLAIDTEKCIFLES
jgi:hypothetical protein